MRHIIGLTIAGLLLTGCASTVAAPAPTGLDRRIDDIATLRSELAAAGFPCDDPVMMGAASEHLKEAATCTMQGASVMLEILTVDTADQSQADQTNGSRAVDLLSGVFGTNAVHRHNWIVMVQDADIGSRLEAAIG